MVGHHNYWLLLLIVLAYYVIFQCLEALKDILFNRGLIIIMTGVQ